MVGNLFCEFSKYWGVACFDKPQIAHAGVSSGIIRILFTFTSKIQKVDRLLRDSTRRIENKN